MGSFAAAVGFHLCFLGFLAGRSSVSALCRSVTLMGANPEPISPKGNPGVCDRLQLHSLIVYGPLPDPFLESNLLRTKIFLGLHFRHLHPTHVAQHNTTLPATPASM